MIFVSSNYLFDIEDSFEPNPGLDVTARTPDGDTALHCMAHRGDVRAIELLVGAGAAVDEVGDMGHTPLHYAVKCGHPEAVRCLLRYGANRSVQNEFRQTPEEVATSTKNDALKAVFDGDVA